MLCVLSLFAVFVSITAKGAKSYFLEWFDIKQQKGTDVLI